jgi:hypothetical protein
VQVVQVAAVLALVLIRLPELPEQQTLAVAVAVQEQIPEVQVALVL